MKSRTKDLIVLLAATGAGLGTVVIVAAALQITSSLLGITVFVLTGWKINSLMSEAIDHKCPSCDYLNSSEASYCSKCGARLKNGVVIPQPPPYPQSQTIVSQPST